MFSDQSQVCIILPGSKETSRGSFWDLFDPRDLRCLPNNLHFNCYVLEICKKDPCATSGQDQKDCAEACALDKACLEIISTAAVLFLFSGTKNMQPFIFKGF